MAEPVRPDQLAVGQTWRGRSAPQRTIVELVPDQRPGGGPRPLIRYQAAHRIPRRYLVTANSFAAWAEELVSSDTPLGARHG